MTMLRVNTSLRRALQVAALIGLVCLASCVNIRSLRRSVRLSEVGSFEVKPQYICKNQEVTVSWAVRATKTVKPEDCPTRFDIVGLCDVYKTAHSIERPLAAVVGLQSEPTNHFAAPPPPRVRALETVGERSISLEEDTFFKFVAFIEEKGPTEEEVRYVTVFQAGESGELRPEVFPYNCAPRDRGWLPHGYARGELASDEAAIYRVDNVSGFTVTVHLMQDDSDPPREFTLADGDCTDEFNGPYWGVWTVSADLDQRPNCTPPNWSPGDALFRDGSEDLELVVEPLPDIKLIVSFGCAESRKVLCPEPLPRE